MKQLLLLSILSFLYVILPAQELNHVNVYGGEDEVGGMDVTTDVSNNIYACGYFNGIADFDASDSVYNLISIDTINVYVTKTNAQGNFIWAKQIGGIGDSYPTQLAVDDLGNVYVTGFFESTIDLDPGPNNYNVTSNGHFDAFIIKLDPDGNFVWAHTYGGNEPDSNQAIEIGPEGNLYITGIFNLTVDFDPGDGEFLLTSMGGDYDVYVSKLDPDGNFIWAKRLGGSCNITSIELTVDESGNVYSTGYYGNGIPDFDPGPEIYNLEVNGSVKMYISKLDVDGNFVWARHLFGNISRGNGIAVQGNDLVVTGYFLGTTDFDVGPGSFEMTSFNLFDGYILKLDTDGNFEWAKQIGGTGRDECLRVKFASDGSIITHGVFEGTADFDVVGSGYDLTSYGLHDNYVLSLESSGAFSWVSQIGGTSLDQVKGLAVDANNDVLTTGYFLETADFDPSTNNLEITSLGQTDAFVIKLGGGIVGISENFDSKFRLYPNPTNNNFTLDLGKEYADVRVEMTNMLGELLVSKTYEHTNSIQLSIEGATGIYFVRVSNSKGLLDTIKIMKY